MKIGGGCHCGFIAYEAEADVDKVIVCHCTDCQTLSGTAFRTVVLTREGTFKLLTGEPKIYIKTGESGRQRTQSFCPQCGTPICSGPLAGGPNVHSIRLGTVHQRHLLVPKLQIWARSAQEWVCELGEIQRMQEQPEMDSKGAMVQV